MCDVPKCVEPKKCIHKNRITYLDKFFDKYTANSVFQALVTKKCPRLFNIFVLDKALTNILLFIHDNFLCIACHSIDNS